MPDKIRGLLRRRPLWIITCYRNNRMEVLTIDQNGDVESALPVFSFEEEAQTFLRLSEKDQEEEGGSSRWRTRKTTAGELVSILMAPCAEVRRVILDPLPLPLGRAMIPYISIVRERFVEELLLMGEPRELARERLVPA